VIDIMDVRDIASQMPSFGGNVGFYEVIRGEEVRSTLQEIAERREVQWIAV
jgi:hypothetical protein